MCDEVGQASEQTPTQLTLEDGVHLPQQHVLQLAGACKPRKNSEHYAREKHIKTYTVNTVYCKTS